MKRLLILFLALLSAVSFASVHRPVRARHRIHMPRRTTYSVPWKVVAAGGAAAGTVIAAYKVSDGVEEGIKTVAKEKPEVIPETLSVITWPVRWAMLVLFLISGYWIWRRFKYKTTSTPKG